MVCPTTCRSKKHKAGSDLCRCAAVNIRIHGSRQSLAEESVLAVKGRKTSHSNEELTAYKTYNSKVMQSAFGDFSRTGFQNQNSKSPQSLSTKHHAQRKRSTETRTIGLRPSASTGHTHHATIPLRKSKKAVHSSCQGLNVPRCPKYMQVPNQNQIIN